MEYLLKKYSKRKMEVISEEIEGIPKEELIEFIFNEKGFPSKIACEHFGMTTPTHSKISTLLKNAEIILKNSKNQNRLELNEDFSRREVSLALSGGVSTPFKIFRKPLSNQEKTD